jgi:type IX secretion system PorP/SprF family membrane protein
MKRVLFITLLVIGLANSGYAQQVPLYSQYMMNGFLLNPAVAGSEGYTAINITAREQWLGLKDAPRTHALSGQTRILKNSYISKNASVKRRRRMASRSGKVGLGGYVFNDKNGPIDRTGIQLSYAYHLRIRQAQLSFGISGIGYQFSVDDSKIRLQEQDDELYMNANKSVFIPDASVGIYFSHPEFYAGLSAAQLFQSSLILGTSKRYAEYKMKRYYYLTAGYDVYINDILTIEPSFLIKANENRTWQADFNAKLIFNEEYWGGLSYRTGGAMIFMGGVKVDKFLFGYAFDYTLSSIMKRSYGSHEFMIAVLFGDSARRYRWLNRY